MIQLQDVSKIYQMGEEQVYALKKRLSHQERRICEHRWSVRKTESQR